MNIAISTFCTYPPKIETMPIQRRNSLPPSFRYCTQEEQKAIQSKHSTFWKCLGRKQDVKGHLYYFVIKEEYANTSDMKVRQIVEKKLDEIYPAVEPILFLNRLAILSHQSQEEFVKDQLSLLIEKLQSSFETYFTSASSADFTGEENKQQFLKDLTSSLTFKIIPKSLLQLFLKMDPNDINAIEDCRAQIEKAITEMIQVGKVYHASLFDSAYKSAKKTYAIYKALGYHFAKAQEDPLIPFTIQRAIKADQWVLTLPDHKALDERWKRLQMQIPNLPSLCIWPLKKNPTDLQFSATYLFSDIFLCHSNQFIHDHLNHAIKVIRLILSSPFPYEYAKDYNAEKFRLVKCVSSIFRQIHLAKRVNKKKHLEIIECSLAVRIDRLTARDRYPLRKTEEIAEAKFGLPTHDCDGLMDVWKGEQIQTYWKQRFKGKKLNIDKLNKALKKILSLEVRASLQVI